MGTPPCFCSWPGYLSELSKQFNSLFVVPWWPREVSTIFSRIISTSLLIAICPVGYRWYYRKYRSNNSGVRTAVKLLLLSSIFLNIARNWGITIFGNPPPPEMSYPGCVRRMSSCASVTYPLYGDHEKKSGLELQIKEYRLDFSLLVPGFWCPHKLKIVPFRGW